MSISSIKNDWAEQDPNLWWKYTCLAIKRVCKESNVDPKKIISIGISYQMHGLVIVDSNGEPLAIREFNTEFKDLKLGKFFDHINDFKFPLAKGQIYTLHDLNNVDYEKYIGIYNSESLSGKEKDKFRSLLDD